MADWRSCLVFFLPSLSSYSLGFCFFILCTVFPGELFLGVPRGPVVRTRPFPAVAHPGSIPGQRLKPASQKKNEKPLPSGPSHTLYPSSPKSPIPPVVFTVSQPPGIEWLSHGQNLIFCMPHPIHFYLPHLPSLHLYF